MTREDVMREMSEHLATRKPTAPLIRLDNWAAMAGLTYKELYARTRWHKSYRATIEQYMAASRAYHEAVHAELRAAGTNSIHLLRPIAAKYEMSIKTVRNKATRMGLPSGRTHRISLERCAAHAKVGMTLRELAEATGYKEYSLANLIPRGRFAGKLEFALRPTKTVRGQVRFCQVIVGVHGRR